MDHLKKFIVDFKDNKVITKKYTQIIDVEKQDTYCDDKSYIIYTPIIKCSRNNTIVKIPNLFDGFVGIIHSDTILNVSLILNNYVTFLDPTIPKSEIKCNLCTINGVKLWLASELPIPLSLLRDKEYNNFDVLITKTNQKIVHTTIEACYYRMSVNMKSELANNMIYKIPLLNESSYLELVCGLWGINVERTLTKV
jgi:hypothetical protein